MKKILSIFLLLIVLSASFVASAENTVITNEEEMYVFEFPEKFSVITEQNMGLHQEYLEDQGIDGDNLISNFKNSGITAFGYTEDDSEELVAVVLTDSEAKNVFNFDRLTEEELDNQIQTYYNSANEENKIEINNAEYVMNNGVKFIRASYFDRSDEEQPLSVVQYFSLQNGKYYFTYLYHKGETDLDVLADDFAKTMEGYKFTEILEPTRERQIGNDYSKLIPIFLSAALIIGLIIIVTIMVRSDKNKKIIR